MPLFRKKPVVIEAVQWNGVMRDLYEICGDLPTYGKPFNGALRVSTLEGDMALQLGDWLIKGVNGELYPCRADIFAKTYEVVTDDTLTFARDHRVRVSE